MSVTTTPEAEANTGRTTAGIDRRVGGGLLDPKMLWHSLPDASKKLDPRVQLATRSCSSSRSAPC